PGPCAMTAARYDDSPVGPYRELAVGQPARLGARLGLCITTMAVTSVDSRLGGRVNWGFPKELGTLSWSSSGAERTVRWEEREIEVRAAASGPPLPVLVPLWAVQRRSDGLVTVGGRLRGLARLASVEISVPDDDPLAGLSGRHRGAVVSGAHLVMSKARLHEKSPVAERSPRGAAEPALSFPFHRGD
ncbi:MAG TPA: acetoacetate decarboxylase family protein, partial [Acidimicrobiales bacterium]